MRHIFSVVVAFTVGCSTQEFKLPENSQARAKISPVMLHSMSGAPHDTHIAWIYLTDKGEEKGKSYLHKLDLPISKSYRKALEEKGVRVRTESRWLNAVSVEGSVDEIEDIADLSFVLRVEQVKKGIRPPTEPSDPEPKENIIQKDVPQSRNVDYGPSLTQISKIGVPELHAFGFTGKGITICLLDVGFRKSHRAFKFLQLVGEHDFVMGDDHVDQDPNQPNDFDDSHGTATLSVIGGYDPGNIIGPAFGASYLLAKTEDGRTETPIEEDYWVAGVEWAKQRGAKIISNSLGYTKFDDKSAHPYTAFDGQTLVISRAAYVASQFGILVVNAMGNEGPELKTLDAPADAFGVLSVGAVDSSGLLADFSSRGPTADGRIKPDLVAPGVDIYVATVLRNDSYGRSQGTSYSAPLVAGVAALLWEAHPEWSLEQMKGALMQTASRALKPNNHYGYGIISGTAALDYKPTGLPLTLAANR